MIVSNSEYDKLQKFLKINQYTWLVTGVAGFIGSNLLEKLLILNQKVIGLDNFEIGFKGNLNQAINDANLVTGKKLDNNFRFIEGDINNIEDCKNACNGVDYVLHNAAIGSVPRSIEDPIFTNRANIDGFLNMLIASRDSKVKRFVYASSSAIYGDHLELPKIEGQMGNLLSPYAVTKYVNELYASIFKKNYNFDTIGLRYFNIFGKRQDPDGVYAAVIPKWILGILNNLDTYINGDGKTGRDFCYVDNAIQMSLLAATTKNKEAINQVYNVALNDITSLNNLYQMIESRIIENIPTLKKKKLIHRDFRLGDIKYSQASIDKAKKLLGYNPKYKIKEGLTKVIDWYINFYKK